MSRPMRDDFSEKTKEQLRSRVNGLCSNPSCKKPTIGPGESNTSVMKLGKACHITAAASGGPRYDKSMAPDLRRNISNGIWLCNTCAELIDRDSVTYTETCLRTWKRNAESRAREMMEGGTSIATKYATPPQLFGLNLVNELPAIDPRFEYLIKVNTNKPMALQLAPLEKVEFEISPQKGFEDKFAEQRTCLLKYGIPFALPSSQVIISGSPLFPHLQSAYNEGTIRISGNEAILQAKLSLYNQDHQLENVTQCQLHLWQGSLGAATKLCIADGMITIDSRIERVEGRNKIDFALEFDIAKWIGMSLFELPQYDKICLFLRCIEKQGYARIDAKMDGKWEVFAKRLPFDGQQFDAFIYTIAYIEECKLLARLLDLEIRFNLASDTCKCSPLEQISDVIRRIRYGARIDVTQITWPVKLTYSTPSCEALSPEQFGDISVIERTPTESIEIFGMRVTLPRKVITITCANIETIEKEGELFVANLRPTDNTYVTEKFDP